MFPSRATLDGVFQDGESAGAFEVPTSIKPTQLATPEAEWNKLPNGSSPANQYA